MKRRTFLTASGALAAAQALPLSALAAAPANALTLPWTGPYGGVPAFDKVRVEDFRGAIDLALAAERAEIDAIAGNKAPPTFANTIEALEQTGQMTSRVLAYYFIWTNTLASPEVQKVEEAVEPLLAAHQDAILQNAALFRRIDAVYAKGADASLTPEQSRLVWLHHTRFVRAGARLTGPQKARVAAINQELAGLFTRFSQNLLADETDYVLYLKTEAELTGLPDDIRAAAAGAAEARGRKGEWAILNTRSSMDPFLMMMRVWPAATARVREEVAEMQALADAEKLGVKIEPWDYRYYAEKVRAAKYDLDMNEVKGYLQLENLREGMFWVAGQLFGFAFEEVKGLPVAHPDIRIWEVKGREGQHVGLWYFDPYARPGKRSGAWMSAYRDQRTFGGKVTTIVSNNSNFVKGAPGEPVLISWDDADTLFHEFGHALHGLCSAVTYPSLSGTSVPRDYVEFPSQVIERWLPTPEVLNRFALHHRTGKPLPAELAARIEKASTFRQGFDVTEYLSSALIDMKLHLAGDADIDPRAFEKDELAKLGMPRELPMRHRTPQFQHVFAGDGYSAGYYSYQWSEVIAMDAFGAFTEAGGPYDKAVARRLQDTVLSVGNTLDPAQQYRNFRGRDPEVKAYLRDKGFPTT